MTLLLARSDDLGSFVEANQAIDIASRQGIVRAASIMVPCAGYGDAVRRFSGRTDIDIGLHATITCEYSSGPRWGTILPGHTVPDLVREDQTMYAHPQDLHGLDIEEQIIAEVSAQLNQAQRDGLRIAYLDSHMDFEWIHPLGEPQRRVRLAMIEIARRAGIPYFDHLPSVGAVELAGRPMTLLVPEGVTHESIQEFHCKLEALLGSEDILVVCHPAELGDVINSAAYPPFKIGEIAQQRSREFQMMIDPGILGLIHEKGVQLVGVTEYLQK